VIEDERADPHRKGKLDEVELKHELLDDDKIETLYAWRLSHPKSTMEAGETSASSPVLAIQTSSSGPAIASIDAPAYDSEKPEITVTTSEGGTSLVSSVFEKVQMSPTIVANLFFPFSRVLGQPAVGDLPQFSRGAITTTTESIVVTTSTAAPAVHVTKASKPGPEEEKIHVLHDDPTDDVIMLEETEEAGVGITLKEML